MCSLPSAESLKTLTVPLRIDVEPVPVVPFREHPLVLPEPPLDGDAAELRQLGRAQPAEERNARHHLQGRFIHADFLAAFRASVKTRKVDRPQGEGLN